MNKYFIFLLIFLFNFISMNSSLFTESFLNIYLNFVLIKSYSKRFRVKKEIFQKEVLEFEKFLNQYSIKRELENIAKKKTKIIMSKL